MNDGLAIEPWLDRSRAFFASLSEGVGLNGPEQASAPSTIENAEKISLTLRSLQEWMAGNPCPDWELRDRVHLLAARYGYVVLVGAPDWEASHRATQAPPLNQRLKELKHDLEVLLSDIERVGTVHDDRCGEN